jgi:hypothetical protein
MGHPSILVNHELVRAVRHESAAAIRFWWGVSPGVVERWRRTLGVTRTNIPSVLSATYFPGLVPTINSSVSQSGRQQESRAARKSQRETHFSRYSLFFFWFFLAVKTPA